MNEVEKTTTEIKTETLNVLKGFLDGSLKIPFREYGICHNVEYLTGGYCAYFKHFKTWKHYSGSKNYPVPNPNKNSSWGPGWTYSRSIFKWSRRRWYHDLFRMKMQYSHLRWDLVKHIISEIEKELKV